MALLSLNFETRAARNVLVTWGYTDFRGAVLSRPLLVLDGGPVRLVLRTDVCKVIISFVQSTSVRLYQS